MNRNYSEEILHDLRQIFYQTDPHVCMCGNSNSGFCDNHSYTPAVEYYMRQRLRATDMSEVDKEHLLKATLKMFKLEIASNKAIKNMNTPMKANAVDKVTIGTDLSTLTLMDKAQALHVISTINDRLNLSLNKKIEDKASKLLDLF